MNMQQIIENEIITETTHYCTLFFVPPFFMSIRKTGFPEIPKRKSLNTGAK